ncbi:MAG TPA: hypothetical protein VLL27_10835 [Solirubrobacterales bacterium]|nr:hypothetical protein [Solirubrobacterales bacterium]
MATKIASGDEAAAIAAAIARLETETAGVPAEAPVTVSAWQRAALLEGVGAKEAVQKSKGKGSTWLS